MTDETRRQAEGRLLEALSAACSTAVVAAGFVGLRLLGHWLLTKHYACWGMGMPAPTQYVVDLIEHPASVGALPALLPTTASLCGAWLRRHGWPMAGTTGLVLAPQLAFIEVLLAFAALVLPVFSVLVPC